MRPTTISVSLTLFAGLLIATGCSLLPSGDDYPDAREGFYSWGFEESRFSPCLVSESWWVITTNATGALSDSLSRQYSRVATQHYEQVYVRFVGSESAEGQYGHLGAYEREFRLSEIVEMRSARSGDCKAD